MEEKLKGCLKEPHLGILGVGIAWLASQGLAGLFAARGLWR